MTRHGVPHTVDGQVVRHVLSSSHPLAAPGEVLELVQYTIPAGATLPVHRHPGDQMAIVEAGELTYHVMHDGAVTVHRSSGVEETIEPGQVTTSRSATPGSNQREWCTGPRTAPSRRLC